MSIHAPTRATHSRTYTLTATALMTAVDCILGGLSIPIGPIPLSLTNFAVFLSLYLLGWRRGTVSYLAYLCIGAVGMPVFSGFTGGLGRLVGPTGGYLIGAIPMTILAGLVIERTRNRLFHLLGMLGGLAICYTFGTGWYCILSKLFIMEALSICVLPFLPGDFLKCLLAMWIGPLCRQRLTQATAYR